MSLDTTINLFAEADVKMTWVGNVCQTTTVHSIRFEGIHGIYLG